MESHAAHRGGSFTGATPMPPSAPCFSRRQPADSFKKCDRIGSRFRLNGGGAIMRSGKVILCILSMPGICALAERIASQTPAQGKRIVIAASTMLDGQGGVLHDTRIAIEGSKIVAIDPKAGPVDYDLRGLTVLPGWIDAHAHITWSFGKDGKNAGAGETTQEAAYQAASNAWVTLMAGFTTVQSPGSSTAVPLRDAIAKGLLPGPRILTAVEPLSGR